MPPVTSYIPGAPAWLDLATGDPDVSREFYGSLLGWDFDIWGPETGGYTMCLRNGSRAAGIVPAGSVSPVWTTYLGSNDIDATAERMTQAGGTLLTGPADAGPAGRVVVATDPLGASIGAWKGNEHPGTEIVDEVGTLVWTELHTPDLEASMRFYSDVFGHTWADEETGEGGPQYRVFSAGGQLAGGAMQTDGGGSFWLPYFGVADTDATVAAATTATASVLQGPQESAYGKMAVLRDPHGATFAVIEVADAPVVGA